MTKNAGLFYAVAAAVGLGAITTQAKMVYAEGGNAMTIMLFRFIVTVLVMAMIVAVRKKPFKLPKEIKTPVFLLGLGWSGSMICYLSSVQTISVSLAVLVLYSYPVLVMVYSIVSGQVKASVGLVAVFILVFLGLGLLLSNGLILSLGWGLFLVCLAAIGAAYTFLSGSRISPQIDVFVLTFWVNLLGAILIIPFVIGEVLVPQSVVGWGFLAGATLCYLVAIVCQFKALNYLPAERAAFIFNLEPLISIFLAMAFLQETLSTLQWLGAVLVLSVLLGFNKVVIWKNYNS